MFLGLGIAAIGIAILSYSQGAPQRSLAETLSKDGVVQQPVDPKRFEAADKNFRERRDFAKARAAYEAYRELHQKNADDYEASWHLSMACYYMGERVLEKETSALEKIHAEGRDAGEASLRTAPPKCAPCHFWTAINMALYGRAVGVFKMLFSLNGIRKHLEESIEADPSYMGGGAYRLLGKIYEKVPGIFGGSDKKARENYEKAIAAGPDEPLNYLFLAQILKDEFSSPKESLAIAEKGLTVPPPTAERIEAVDALADLKKFVEANRAATGSGTSNPAGK